MERHDEKNSLHRPGLRTVRSRVTKHSVRFVSHRSFVGILLGTLFLALSLSPSLVPRTPMLQGVVSGITMALGYGIGTAGEWLWRYLQLPEVHGRTKRPVKTVLSVAAGTILAYFYGHATLWQNSIRELMEMPPVEGSSLLLVTGVALGLALLLVLIARGIKALYYAAAKRIYRLVPRRVSYVIGSFLLTFLLVTLINGVLVKRVIDALEYLYNGDTAIVGVQYSYLSSPVTLILDPDRARDSARIVFSTIYKHWRSLPKDDRPDLYLHGLSLGSLGAEDSAQLYTLIADPIDGAFYAGPPFANSTWPRLKEARNPDSPAWLPTFEDGSLVRFMGQDNSQSKNYSPWGPIRVVYLLYPSDASFPKMRWTGAPGNRRPHPDDLRPGRRH